MNIIFLFFALASISFAQNISYEVMLNRKDVIWGFDFLPDGNVLLSEREGKLIHFNPKTKSVVEIQGLPEVKAVGQGGLLDVRVHPDFKKNGFIFFTYSEPQGNKSTTALMRAKLQGNKLIDKKPLFSGLAANTNDIHYGSRIEFDGKGHIFLTMGDRDERKHAQELNYHQGKIIRINEDGSTPKDNPFISKAGARPEIWSMGHRSPQGLVFHPVTGELWEAEMGPQGGDEINLIRPGLNYGWPVITFGREYSGRKIGESAAPGLEQPVTYWVPSISPSAITFHTGNSHPEWKNNLFVATLSGEHIRRLEFKEGKISKQEELLKDLGLRWRSLRTGPDGYLYAGTDEGTFGRLK